MIRTLKKNPLWTIGLLLLIAAATVAFWTADKVDNQSEADRKTVNTVRERQASKMPLQPSREPRERARLLPSDVVKMTPKDWTVRFDEFPSEVSAEYKQEIVLLAGELEQLLKDNPDPNGIEAQVFGDAILTLLAEGRRPD